MPRLPVSSIQTRSIVPDVRIDFRRVFSRTLNGLRGLFARPRGVGRSNGVDREHLPNEADPISRVGWPLSGKAAPAGVTSMSFAGGGLRLAVMRNGQVNFWQHVPLQPGLIAMGVVVNPDGFAAALRETLDRFGLPRKLVCALPGAVATARLLAMPASIHRDIAASVAREAALAMAVSPEEHYLYWQAVGAPGQVFAVAVQKAAVDNLTLACTLAKTEVQAVDLKPLALALAAKTQEAVIADVEASGIEIVIVAQGLPVALRSVAFVDDVLDPAFARSKLVDELGIAMQLYDGTNPEMPLAAAAPIYLTGELSDDDLAGKVAFVTRRPIVQPEPPYGCPPGLPAMKFMTNLGLLMKRC